MKNRYWKNHGPTPQEREAPPIEDDPRLRHGVGAHHAGQRARAKKRQRLRTRRNRA